MCAVLSSVCATTVDNSGVNVYYLKGIVSVCFRCPARTVGFSGTHLYLDSLLSAIFSLLQSTVGLRIVCCIENFKCNVRCFMRNTIQSHLSNGNKLHQMSLTITANYKTVK